MTPAARTCATCRHFYDDKWSDPWCQLVAHETDPSAWCALHTPKYTPTAPARAETDDA